MYRLLHWDQDKHPCAMGLSFVTQKVHHVASLLAIKQFNSYSLGTILTVFITNKSCSTILPDSNNNNPDSKVHGASMRPTWVLSAPDGPHVSPMILAIRKLLAMVLHGVSCTNADICLYTDILMQDCGISILEKPLFCTKPSIDIMITKCNTQEQCHAPPWQ